MAKRRSGGGGGGSNIGLIITLIFFICATIALGVTTYLGYSELAQYEAVNKKAEKSISGPDKDKLFTRLKVAEDDKIGHLVNAKYILDLLKEIEWYKFQARVYRAWMGQPYKGGGDASVQLLALELARQKAAMKKGGADATKGDVAKYGAQPDADDVRKLLAKLDEAMPWDAPNSEKDVGKPLEPPTTYETLLKDKDLEIKKARDQVTEIAKKLEDASEELKQVKATLKQERDDFLVKLKGIQDASVKDLSKDREHIAKLQKDLNVENKAKEAEKLRSKQAEAKATELEAAVKDKDTALAQANKDKTEVVTSLTAIKDQFESMRKRLREDDKTLSDRALDAEAIRVLRSWPQSKMRWKIIRLDQKGTKPYINLGSGDGLETGMTFSIHAMGRDGKLNPLPKGTVEVTELIRNEPRLARVRVTGVTDPKNDPIVVGDHLFNPTFSPGSPKRVAIAGLADLGGEGTDSSADLRRLLKRQGVIVDAYVSTKDDKEPRVLKEGDDKDAKGEVTAKTTYLIVADGFEVATRHPKRSDKDYAKKFGELVAEMQERARANGVTVVSLSRYLDMIGYKPPKAITTRQR